MKTSFEDHLDQLNPAQKSAVETIEGPVMVIAGPGTGKTHVLTMRIASILANTDTQPASILALTFTDSAAANMRSRLVKIIGQAAYNVTISTFHAFCSSIISMHQEHFVYDSQSAVLTEIEQLKIIRELLFDLELQVLKPKLKFDYWAKQIKSSISQLKREGITPTAFAQMVADEPTVHSTADTNQTRIQNEQRRLAQLADLSRLYHEYDQRLKGANRLDYDDLIMNVLESISAHPALLAEIQEQYLYILVDEYQDTNSSQNTIVRSISSFWGEQANIFVVGDPNQSIFRFQGASLLNTVDFLRWYPHAKVITLTEGYRCPPNIYQLAHSSISLGTLHAKNSNELLPQSLYGGMTSLLHSQSQDLTPIQLTQTTSREHQFIHVVGKIKDLIAAGTSEEHIAVLVRRNVDALTCASYFETEEVPYRLASGRDALAEPISIQLQRLLKLMVAAKAGEEVSDLLFDVLCLPWFDLNLVAIFALARSAGKNHISLWELCLQIDEEDGPRFDGISVSDVKKIGQTVRSLSQWAAEESQQPVEIWLRNMFAQSGLLAYLMQAKQLQFQTSQLIALKSVMDFIQRLAENSRLPLRIVDVLATFETMQAQGLIVPLLDSSEAADKITISTVHKAKGLEWKHVFLIDLVEKRWGKVSKKSGLPFPKDMLAAIGTDQQLSRQQMSLEDERRLFYVAVTRAQSQLHLYTYLNEERVGQTTEALPSIFLTELQNDPLMISEPPRMKVVNVTPANQLSSASLHHQIGPRNTKQIDSLTQYVQGLVSNFSLSVTSLNNYLKSPKKFFVSNLLQLPSAKSASLLFGTVCHQALQQWYLQPNNRSTAKNAQIIENARAALVDQMKYFPDAETWVQDGVQTLSSYFSLAQAEPLPTIAALEYETGRNKRSAVFNGISLRGRMDRLDWADESRKSLIVIDYKTGRPRTQNDILAKTIASQENLSSKEVALPSEIRGPYYRQLLFYRLLGELDQTLRQPISIGMFDFVENPRRHGKICRRKFEIPTSDLNLLKDLIIDVMKEINSLSFLEDMLLEDDLFQFMEFSDSSAIE